MPQLSQLETDFRDFSQDLPETLWNPEEFRRLINKVQRDFVLRTLILRKRLSITTVKDDPLYDAPIGYLQMLRVEYNNKPLAQEAEERLDLYRPSWRTQAASDPEAWLIGMDGPKTVRLFPAIAEANLSKPLVFIYHKVPDDLDPGTEVLAETTLSGNAPHTLTPTKQPNNPAQVTCTFNNASAVNPLPTGITFAVTGLDHNGKVKTETIAVANGSSAGTTAAYFLRVTSIVFAFTGGFVDTGASGDKVKAATKENLISEIPDPWTSGLVHGALANAYLKEGDGFNAEKAMRFRGLYEQELAVAAGGTQGDMDPGWRRAKVRPFGPFQQAAGEPR